MARARSTFKKQDITRALLAADAAGREVHRVEIDRDGKIVLIMAEPAEVPSVSDADIVL